MNKICKFFLKLFGILFVVNAALFAVFFFDLDGKALFYGVEPFLSKHYDKMPRRDPLSVPYDVEPGSKS